MKKIRSQGFSFLQAAGNYKINNFLELISEILIQYNCRASEILNAKWTNFFPDQFLILEGKKRSQPVIIRDRYILEKIKEVPRVNDTYIFGFIPYSSLYHYFKQSKSHLFPLIKNKKNQAVTHAPRYYAAAKVSDEKFLKSILHHNSLKSQLYYKRRVQNEKLS